MQQEFEPKLPRDILKMSKNKSFDVRARFGAIYSASKPKKHLLKNSTIGNRLLFEELANVEFTCPENLKVVGVTFIVAGGNPWPLALNNSPGQSEVHSFGSCSKRYFCFTCYKFE